MSSAIWPAKVTSGSHMSVPIYNELSEFVGRQKWVKYFIKYGSKIWQEFGWGGMPRPLSRWLAFNGQPFADMCISPFPIWRVKLLKGLPTPLMINSQSWPLWPWKWIKVTHIQFQAVLPWEAHTHQIWWPQVNLFTKYWAKSKLFQIQTECIKVTHIQSQAASPWEVPTH